MKLSLLIGLSSMLLAACAPASRSPAASARPSSETPVISQTVPAASAEPPEAIPSAPADPTKEAEIDARIDKVLGDHVAYRSVLERLQAAVAADDRSGVAALVRYPLDARTQSGKLHIANAQAFVAHYQDIVTPAVAQVVAAQRYQALFVSQNGVMLGAGEVWINGVCHDPQCVDVDVKVATFQHGG
jgi:hypothetical protein